MTFFSDFKMHFWVFGDLGLCSRSGRLQKQAPKQPKNGNISANLTTLHFVADCRKLLTLGCTPKGAYSTRGGF